MNNNNNYSLKFHIIKQLYISKYLWLPASISIGLEKEWYDTFGLSFYFPIINDGVNAENLFDGVTSYGVRFPTEILFNKENNIYCGFIVKLLGWGIGVHRQWSY